MDERRKKIQDSEMRLSDDACNSEMWDLQDCRTSSAIFLQDFGVHSWLEEKLDAGRYSLPASEATLTVRKCLFIDFV